MATSTSLTKASSMSRSPVATNRVSPTAGQAPPTAQNSAKTTTSGSRASMHPASNEYPGTSAATSSSSARTLSNCRGGGRRDSVAVAAWAFFRSKSRQALKLATVALSKLALQQPTPYRSAHVRAAAGQGPTGSSGSGTDLP
eukprot:11228287-Lingulodinium_polyedra.AAC.2